MGWCTDIVLVINQDWKSEISPRGELVRLYNDLLGRTAINRIDPETGRRHTGVAIAGLDVLTSPINQLRNFRAKSATQKLFLANVIAEREGRITPAEAIANIDRNNHNPRVKTHEINMDNAPDKLDYDEEVRR